MDETILRNKTIKRGNRMKRYAYTELIIRYMIQLFETEIEEKEIQKVKDYIIKRLRKEHIKIL